MAASWSVLDVMAVALGLEGVGAVVHSIVHSARTSFYLSSIALSVMVTSLLVLWSVVVYDSVGAVVEIIWITCSVVMPSSFSLAVPSASGSFPICSVPGYGVGVDGRAHTGRMSTVPVAGSAFHIA